MPKINELTNLASPASDDLFVVVDTSDTTESANGTTKRTNVSSIISAFSIVDLDTTPFTVDSTYKSGSVFEQTVSTLATANITTSDFDVGTNLIFSANFYGLTVDVGSGNSIYNLQTVTLGSYQTIGMVKSAANLWIPITRGVYSLFRRKIETAASKVFTLPDLFPGNLVTYYNTYNAGVAAWTLPTKTVMDAYLGNLDAQQIQIKNTSGSNNMTVSAGTSTTIEGGNKTLADGAAITLVYAPGTTATWYVVSTYGTVT